MSASIAGAATVMPSLPIRSGNSLTRIYSGRLPSLTPARNEPNICSPEAASSQQSSPTEDIVSNESEETTESESETSLSHELSNHKELTESLWAGHLAQSNR